MEQKKKKRAGMLDIDLARELSHGICVSNLAFRVGKELGLDGEFCYRLAEMGLLHDVGKQEMWKTVRRRGAENTLLVEELRYLRTHPALGYAMLNELGYPEEQTEWVLYHHENYDGTGYPANKSGENIPLGARILRVCDVFAALTTDRPYRKACTVEQALEQMIRESKNFDMRVFLALMNIIHKTDPEELLDHQDPALKRAFGMEKTISEFEKESEETISEPGKESEETISEPEKGLEETIEETEKR